MGGIVVPDLEDISLCEVVGSWTGSPTPAQNDTTIWDSIQGTRCMQSYNAGAVVRNASWDFGAGNQKSFAGKLLYIWFAFSKKAYSASAGTMKIRLTDVNGYYRDWYIFDKTSLPNTSWICWAIHADIGYDYESNALFDSTQIRYVAWRIDDTVLGKTYIWWDAVRFGTGLTIKSGTSGDPANFEKLYTEEILNANAYGVVSKVSGVYLIQGQIKIGSTVNAESTYFKSTSKVVVFRTIKGNPPTFSKILFQGNAGADTEIYFGNVVGVKGVSGLFISSESPDCRYALDATSTSRMKWQLCGTTFFQARRIEFPAYDASWLREVRSCSFESCWEIYPDTTTMEYCNFIAPTGETPAIACRMSSINHNIKYSNFINCSRAIHIPNAETYAFNSLSFSGCTYDVRNSSAGLVTVNYDQYCSPPPSTHEETGGGSTVIQTSVTLTVRHVKTGSEPTNYVRCAIYKKSDMTQIMNADATIADDQNPTYYKASAPYTVTGISVIVRAREKGYLPFETELTIPAGGLDVTAIWIPDPNYT